jgi:hypothetical protein
LTDAGRVCYLISRQFSVGGRVPSSPESPADFSGFSRTGDLLKLKVDDVKSMKVGDTLIIKEGKTGKRNMLVMNKNIHKSLQTYLEKIKPRDDDYFFQK